MTPRAHDIRETARRLLVEEGLLPTNRLVRERLGGGSPNLISETLRLFWQELGTELREASTCPGIPEAVLSVAQTLWKGALTAAEASYVEARTQLEAQIAEAHDTLAQTQGSLTQMTKQMQAAEAERDHLRETLDGAMQRASRAEATIMELTTHLTEARTQAAHQAELAQVHAAHASELKQALEDQVAAAQVREAAQQAELERAVSEYQTLEQRHAAELTAREADHRQAHEAVVADKHSLEAQLADRQRQLDRLQVSLTTTQAEAEAERSEAYRLTDALTKSQQRSETLGRDLSASQAKLASTEQILAEQTAAAEVRFAALLARLDALAAGPPLDAN